jgi:hypothetical protein
MLKVALTVAGVGLGWAIGAHVGERHRERLDKLRG